MADLRLGDEESAPATRITSVSCVAAKPLLGAGAAGRLVQNQRKLLLHLTCAVALGLRKSSIPVATHSGLSGVGRVMQVAGAVVEGVDGLAEDWSHTDVGSRGKLVIRTTLRRLKLIFRGRSRIRH